MAAPARTLDTASPEETYALGLEIGRALAGGECVALVGELGSGKTQLVKGIAAGLEVPDAARAVTSPTFILHARHAGRLVLHHVDAYRLGGGRELEELGVVESLDRGAVLVVEWADRVAGALPDPDWVIELEHAGPDRRRIRIRAGRGGGSA